MRVLQSQMSGAPEPGAPGSVAVLLEDDSPASGGIVGPMGSEHVTGSASSPGRDNNLAPTARVYMQHEHLSRSPHGWAKRQSTIAALPFCVHSSLHDHM